MLPLMLAGPDMLILLAIVVLLFGGAKLAGIGKGAGRALREFKEETRGLASSDTPEPPVGETSPAADAPATSASVDRAPATSPSARAAATSSKDDPSTH